MLVSCSYCGGLHKRGRTCANRPKSNRRKKESTEITRFRSSFIWQKKRAEIKTRDKQLCQVCILDRTYVFKNLQVHHIRPISKAWHERLNNSNLITLCPKCHKMAEEGEIGRAKLLDIAEKNAYAVEKP